MSPFAEFLNRLSVAWASLAWSVVWQSTLVAGVIAAISFALRRSSPTVRYWLWQIVAIKLLIMPLWSVSLTLPKFFHREAAGTQATPDPTGQGDMGGITLPLRPKTLPSGEAQGLTEPKPWRVGEWLSQLHWQSWLFVAWLVGVAWQLAGVIRHRFRLSSLLAQGSEVTDSRVVEMVVELADQISLRRLPRVMSVDLEGSPFVCGMCKPVLVLPRSILTALDPAQLRQVLLHELAHVKRRDLLWVGYLRWPTCSTSSIRSPTGSRTASAWSASWPVTSWRWP